MKEVQFLRRSRKSSFLLSRFLFSSVIYIYTSLQRRLHLLRTNTERIFVDFTTLNHEWGTTYSIYKKTNFSFENFRILRERNKVINSFPLVSLGHYKVVWKSLKKNGFATSNWLFRSVESQSVDCNISVIIGICGSNKAYLNYADEISIYRSKFLNCAGMIWAPHYQWRSIQVGNIWMMTYSLCSVINANDKVYCARM